jgi:hypothetical protein
MVTMVINAKKSRLWHTIKSLTITQFETNKNKTIPAACSANIIEKKIATRNK